EKPWKDVLRWLSDQTGLPVIAKEVPTGKVTIFPGAGVPSTLAEVMDLLNEQLLQQHYLLIRGEKTITLVPSDEKIDPSLVPRVEAQELGRFGRTELVSVVVHLKALVADKVAPSVKKLMGTFGEIVVLPEGNRLVLQDTAGNLRSVYQLLRDIDAKEKAAP